MFIKILSYEWARRKPLHLSQKAQKALGFEVHWSNRYGGYFEKWRWANSDDVS
jgi:hypothetical protein